MAETNRCVVIAVDGSQRADEALDFYLQCLRQANDRVILVHAANRYSMKDASAAIIGELMNVMKEDGDKIEKHYRDKYSGTQFEFKLRFGDCGDQVIATAKEENANFIVLGTRGMGTIRRTFLGSVSDYVIHHTHIPVVIAPPKEKERKQSHH